MAHDKYLKEITAFNASLGEAAGVVNARN